MNVIGIMSGTSLDGVDYVLAKVAKNLKITYLDRASISFSTKMKKALLAISENELDFRSAAEIHYELGAFYASELKKIIKKRKWSYDLIGLHGQTVFHNPPRATLQIGEPSFLKDFNVPVIANFRNKNVAFGGEGAPLAPYFHKCAFGSSKLNTAFLNIGGMTNITYLPKSGKGYATDIGPGNVFVDFIMKKDFKKNYDTSGRKALSGIADASLVLDYVKNHPFYKRRKPKSCGREDFSEKDFLKLYKKMGKLKKEDRVSSFAEISIQFLLKDLKKMKIDKLIVGGGGAKNHYFMNRLQYELNSTEVSTSEDLGWPVEAVEGGAFALLAAMRFWEKPYPLEFLYDRKASVPLGSIY